MPQSETMRDAILDAAESRARIAGYNGFSFRDLAADVGIKSASVHYHFPTKADLAHELMERYRRQALASLGTASGAVEAMHGMAAMFRRAASSGEMCLCGALGASAACVPKSVQLSAARFSEALTAWLRETPDWHEALPMPPEAIVALLEGALLLSVTARDPEVFDRAAAPLIGATRRA